MAKDPFEKLDSIFRDAADHDSDVGLDNRVVESAKARSEYERLRDEDVALEKLRKHIRLWHNRIGMILREPRCELNIASISSNSVERSSSEPIFSGCQGF